MTKQYAILVPTIKKFKNNNNNNSNNHSDTHNNDHNNTHVTIVIVIKKDM